MHYDHITADQHLRDFCESIAAAPIVAFDTEFVSEDSFLPELCLIQLAANERLVVTDLARRHGTSTNPVREALQLLRGEGFVIFVANRGARVRPISCVHSSWRRVKWSARTS